MSTTVLEYLRRLGYPGDWVHADRAMQTISHHGFVVSAAAEDMIRQFGGLDTNRHPPPAIRESTGVRHQPAVFCMSPFYGCISKDDLGEMEAFHGVAGLCPIGFYYGGPGFMCIDPLGRVFFEESVWGYAGTPTEVVVALLSGRPTLCSPSLDV